MARGGNRPTLDARDSVNSTSGGARGHDDPVWINSEPEEEEDWGSDPDKSWEVDRIVDHNIDSRGIMSYKVKWRNWRRVDGSSTTWRHADSTTLQDAPSLEKDWHQKQRRRRLEASKESRSIKVVDLIKVPPGALETRLFDLALNEKLTTKPRNPLAPTYAQWMAEVKLHSSEPKAIGQKTGNKPSSSTIRSSSSDESSPGVSHATTHSVQTASLGKSFKPSPLGNSPQKRPHHTSDGAGSDAVVPAKKKRKPGRTWESILDDAVKRAGRQMAPVIIVNEVDDEPYPALPNDFEYLESDYKFGTGIPSFAEMFPPNRFLGCGGHSKCDMTSTPCPCQAASEMDDSFEGYAYNERGRLNLNYFTYHFREVIECNQWCRCTLECPNRATQRPRTAPIELFKTEGRGWGVRSPKNLPKGTVLGVFTGELVTRDEAEALDAARDKQWRKDKAKIGAEPVLDPRMYIFDLGSDDDDYSVDAWACGNWTRFINHSCRPVVKVYTVVSDSLPQSGLGRLAFATTELVRAGQELTIDYDPRYSVEAKGKGKVQSNSAKGVECKCGEDMCRGWLYA